MDVIKVSSDREVVPIQWRDGKFNTHNLVILNTEGSGSSLFHCIAKALDSSYQIGLVNGAVIDRTRYISDLRKDIANKLEQPIDIFDEVSPIIYTKYQKEINLSLLEAQREISSNKQLDKKYMRLLGDIINVNIYVLNTLTQDVEKTDIPYTSYTDNIDRKSIVVLKSMEKYSLVGLVVGTSPTVIKTVFRNDSLIMSLRKRLNSKT